MKGKRGFLLLLALLGLAVPASAEIQVIDGVRYECSDGLCRRIDAPPVADVAAPAPPASAVPAPRLAQGYMDADAFLAFLRGEAGTSALPASGVLLVLALLLAGAAMNLTPCVLPMVPVNLIVIGKSASRGLLYGLGIALAYGLLGVLAAVGGLAFGTIQSSPVFNAFVALVFVALGLSLGGVFSIDFTRLRAHTSVRAGGALFPLFMGALSAVLAGACVAPVLISALVLTASQYAAGNRLALAFPFVLGLGMALPWPFLGAGLRVLPKPGAWTKGVNRAFAVLVLGFAVWYGRLAVLGWRAPDAGTLAGSSDEATPSTFEAALATARASGRPVLVDCWATWCKNCTAMEKGTLRDPRVVAALEGYAVIRLQAEDLAALTRLPSFGAIRGLPAFAVYKGAAGY